MDNLWAIADALKLDAYQLLLPMAHGKIPVLLQQNLV